MRSKKILAAFGWFLAFVFLAAGSLEAAEGGGGEKKPPTGKKKGTGKKKPTAETPSEEEPPAETSPIAAPVATDASGWKSIVLDEAMSAFDKKGAWSVSGGALTYKSGASGKVTAYATSKEPFGEVELSASVHFEGTGTLNFFLCFTKGDPSTGYELTVKPTNGKASVVTLKVLGGKATGTIDGADAGEQVKTAGTPAEKGPIQILLRASAVTKLSISDLKVRPSAAAASAPAATAPPAQAGPPTKTVPLTKTPPPVAPAAKKAPAPTAKAEPEEKPEKKEAKKVAGKAAEEKKPPAEEEEGETASVEPEAGLEPSDGEAAESPEAPPEATILADFEGPEKHVMAWDGAQMTPTATHASHGAKAAHVIFPSPAGTSVLRIETSAAKAKDWGAFQFLQMDVLNVGAEKGEIRIVASDKINPASVELPLPPGKVVKAKIPLSAFAGKLKMSGIEWLSIHPGGGLEDIYIDNVRLASNDDGSPVSLLKGERKAKAAPPVQAKKKEAPAPEEGGEEAPAAEKPDKEAGKEAAAGEESGEEAPAEEEEEAAKPPPKRTGPRKEGIPADADKTTSGPSVEIVTGKAKKKGPGKSPGEAPAKPPAKKKAPAAEP
ncbi:MAG: hypothetical protein AAB215_00560 [Planctomycetota bacterium]